MSSHSEQELIRRRKLDKLRSLKINPYPAPLYPINNNSKSIKTNFEEGKNVIIAGRIMSRRIQGKASFAELQDGKGKIQIYLNRDEICPGDDKKLYKMGKNSHTLSKRISVKTSVANLLSSIIDK